VSLLAGDTLLREVSCHHDLSNSFEVFKPCGKELLRFSNLKRDIRCNCTVGCEHRAGILNSGCDLQTSYFLGMRFEAMLALKMPVILLGSNTLWTCR
jgi:hypothetical protein